MKNKWLIFLAGILILVITAALFFFIRHNSQKENIQLYAHITGKMKEGGKIHTLLPDIEYLLDRPFLQTDIRNYANILAAYINYRKDNYPAAEKFFRNVKFQGKVFDVQDYVYYWRGKNLWQWYTKTNEKSHLQQAKTCFKQVAQHPYSPMKETVLTDYIKSQYYSDDYSFYDALPDNFAEKIAQTKKSALAEMLYILADANRKKGNRKKCLEYLVRLWKTYPYSKWGERAEIMLEEMKESASIQYPALSARELLDTYDLAYEKNRTKDKLKYIQHRLDILKTQIGNTLQDRINLLYGKVFYVLGPRSRSIQFLTRSSRSGDIETRLESIYFLVRHARNYYQFSQINRLVRSIDSPGYRRSEYYDKTTYAAGFAFMRKKRYSQAIPIYKTVLEKGRNNNEFYDHALWRLQWCYYHLGRYDEAVNILEKLGENKEWEEYATYWTAYIRQRKGQLQDARRLYEYLLKNSGFTYYGMLAWQNLKQFFNMSIDLEKGKQEYVEFKVGLIEDENRNTRYKTLKENGLFEFAAVELETYLEEKGIFRSENQEHWRPYGAELARLYFYTGKYIKAGWRLYWVYKEEILKGAINIPREFWDMYYPVFYKGTIDRYADRYGVSRNFLYAFIRQESFYEPFVVSPAGAIGVMQIMPGTGKQIAKDIASDLGIRSYSAELLYNPEVNIPMGIFHLRKHLYEKIEDYVHKKKISKAYGKDILQALMIAGYNAGIGRSYRWVRETTFDNQQELIDQFDIPETRRYVKLVLKHLFLYSRYKK